jgi:ribonucleoside-triphosphate reductase
MSKFNNAFNKERNMRNLEAIESELESAREALSNVKGTPAEVYTRIVGYYRSVRNWNKGKREEYGQRVMFHPDISLLASCMPVAQNTVGKPVYSAERVKTSVANESLRGSPPEDWTLGKEASERLLLFIRPACPACPSAKAAANKLGLPLELYDADTNEGMAEAIRRQVQSTPTAILLSSDGEELGRAWDAAAIERLVEVNEAVAV